MECGNTGQWSVVETFAGTALDLLTDLLSD